MWFSVLLAIWGFQKSYNPLESNMNHTKYQTTCLFINKFILSISSKQRSPYKHYKISLFTQQPRNEFLKIILLFTDGIICSQQTLVLNHYEDILQLCNYYLSLRITLTSLHLFLIINNKILLCPQPFTNYKYYCTL